MNESLIAPTGRREYEPPVIVYESELEVRAGTQLGLPDPLNLTGTNE